MNVSGEWGDNLSNHIKKLAPVKERVILLITNAGAYGPEEGLNPHFRESVSEPFLKARRICQVPV